MFICIVYTKKREFGAKNKGKHEIKYTDLEHLFQADIGMEGRTK